MGSKTIGSFVTLLSGNEKVGPAAATYAPIAQTCPSTCALRGGNGCYAEVGNVGLHMRRLQDETCAGLNGDTVAILEGAAIRDAARLVPIGRPLRIHVSGDASTPFRARAIAEGASHWNGPVWSYTHAWRDVPREAWGRVSVLASCEDTTSARRALASGYAPAIVTGPHPADGRAYTRDGVKLIPCPAQTRTSVQCVRCRLCFDADKLHAMGAAIAFEAHGASKKRALNVIQA